MNTQAINKSKSITSEQKKVVTFNGQHSIVTAVAGSGKTTTLIKRIEYLIKKLHISPQDILILMYNKDAQVSFEDKLLKINGLPSIPQVRTFHSYAKQIVTKNDKILNRGKHSLLDELSTKELLIQAYKESTGESYYKPEDLEELELFINVCKANNISPESSESDEYTDINGNTAVNRSAFKAFNRLLKENNARTFDDLLLDAMNDLLQYPNCVNKPIHIIVDEYQDVNFIQHTLVRLLTDCSRTKVMIVGDSNQTIYKFRGSDVRFIENIFERDFPNVSHLHLSKSFRFGHAISMIANRVMLKNQSAKAEQLCISASENYATTVKLSNIAAMYELKSFTLCAGTKAILARNRSDLAESLVYLKLNNIPYNTNKSLSSAKQDELAFLSVIAYLALNYESKAFLDPSIIKIAMRGFLNCAELKITRSQYSKLMKTLSSDHSAFHTYILELLATLQHKLNDDIIKFISTQKLPRDKDLYELMTTFEALGVIDIAVDSSCNRRQANHVARLLENLKNLAASSPLQTHNLFNIFSHNNSKDGVVLSTIHGTKGLEWDHVMLTGLNDDSFPSSKDPDEIQEERRLFYVGVTRCIKSLTLHIPEDEMLSHWLEKGWYSTPKRTPIATRFIYESDIQNAIIFSSVCGESKYIPKEFYRDQQYREYHQKSLKI
ncbi:ATP-dependent helicase [Photobacterium leiognathi]|uniref:ATP-dependent helicase n=1 Tax=Photobacterium leiognathi TaxID=553611 RepID=UPI0029826FF5|nr:ATP-dependent helicase [Photobacterium leiognathi]